MKHLHYNVESHLALRHDAFHQMEREDLCMIYSRNVLDRYQHFPQNPNCLYEVRQFLWRISISLNFDLFVINCYNERTEFLLKGNKK